MSVDQKVIQKTGRRETVLLEVENLRAYYITEQFGVAKEVKAVEGVSLSVEGSNFLAIVGESGCGKTTLARVLYGAVGSSLLVKEGRVCYRFGDQEYELSPTKNTLKDAWWKEISCIPQGSLSALNPVRRLRDIFYDLTTSHGVVFDEEKIKSHLEMVDLPPYVLRAYPFELSGGMRQRVVIALATFLNPAVIIADEPTSALDVVTQKNILQLLSDIQAALGSMIVFITHDISLIPGLANMMAVMYGGCIVEYGLTESVFTSPLHPYTRFLLSSMPVIGDKTERKPIPGSPVSLIDPPEGCRFYPRCSQGKDVCTELRPDLIEVDFQHWVACYLYR
jgi:peptide/nickel transport system ATP-binding protein